jgi:hypothetical protein
MSHRTCMANGRYELGVAARPPYRLTTPTAGLFQKTRAQEGCELHPWHPWTWRADDCRLSERPLCDERALHGRRILFVGDSTSYEMFLSLLHLVGAAPADWVDLNAGATKTYPRPTLVRVRSNASTRAHLPSPDMTRHVLLPSGGGVAACRNRTVVGYLRSDLLAVNGAERPPSLVACMRRSVSLDFAAAVRTHSAHTVHAHSRSIRCTLLRLSR